MVISAVARAATKILTKSKQTPSRILTVEQRHAKTIRDRKWRKANPGKLEKYKITTREWRKKNPDKIKAQKKRYSAVRKERLAKQPEPVKTKKQLAFIDWNKKIKTVNTRNLKSDNWGVRSDAGIKRGSYRLQEFTSKPTTSKYPSEQEQWRTVMSSRDVVGSSMFSSFLKGFGKTKPKVKLEPKVYELKPKLRPTLPPTPSIMSDWLIPEIASKGGVRKVRSDAGIARVKYGKSGKRKK